MELLRGALRTYAWGSRTAIAEFTGRPVPAAHPEAELWFGAHPGDPAWLETEHGETSLLTALVADPEGQLGRRVAGPVRRRAAVPGQGAGGRRAAVAAGPPQRRAGGRGLPAGGTAGHSGELAGPQLPRHVAQARVVGGAAAVRGAGRISSGVPNHRAAAGIGGLRPRPVHRLAERPVRRRRSARAVHHLDHRAPARHRRAGARRARRRHPVRQLRAQRNSRPRPRRCWNSANAIPATPVCWRRCCSTASAWPRARRSSCRPATCTPICAVSVWR